MSFKDDYGITDFEITGDPGCIHPYLRVQYAGKRNRPKNGEVWRNPFTDELVVYREPPVEKKVSK